MVTYDGDLPSEVPFPSDVDSTLALGLAIPSEMSMGDVSTLEGGCESVLVPYGHLEAFFLGDYGFDHYVVQVVDDDR